MAAARTSSILAALLGIQCVVARIGDVTVLTEGNFDTFIKSHDKVLVDFCNAESRGEATMSEALTMAKREGHTVNFAMVDAEQQPKLLERYVPRGSLPQIVWFHHGEPTQYHMTARDAKLVAGFVYAVNRDPITAVRNEDEAKNFNRVVIVRTAKGSSLYKMAEVVASKHLDRIAFVWLDGWQGEDSLDAWVSDHEQPYLEDEFTIDHMEHWVHNLLFRSEDIPEFEDEDDAKLVVGHNFEEKVMQPNKDAFLLVFAPWCGFCKKAMPLWEALARTLAPVEHINVFKMDGSRNDAPDPEVFSWRVFPTIFYLKAGSLTPAVFKGNRTLENYVEFAKQHTSKSFELTQSAPTSNADL